MPGLARVWNRLCHTAQAHLNTLLAAPSDSIIRYKMACRYGNRKELVFLLQVMQPAVVWYISKGRPHNNWEDTWTLIYQLESHERLYYVIS